ncbi:hypothetical protein [Dysgonomonas mossii]|uniref:hypothetical protein n=1 Tax=Dysgonomonas mossii TaxID=163665 RepID=UPI0011C9070F|nr:hypothetical protein [Dysgonomonas mossii]
MGIFITGRVYSLAKVFTGLYGLSSSESAIASENLPAVLRPERISFTKLDIPKPYTLSRP